MFHHNLSHISRKQLNQYCRHHIGGNNGHETLKCRYCSESEETQEHIIQECTKFMKDEETIRYADIFKCKSTNFSSFLYQAYNFNLNVSNIALMHWLEYPVMIQFSQILSHRHTFQKIHLWLAAAQLTSQIPNVTKCILLNSQVLPPAMLRHI